MRVVSWNLQAGRGGWTGTLDARVRLLSWLDRQHGAWDVLCAQEIPPGCFDELKDAVGASAGEHAWPETEQPPGDPKDAHTATGAALLVRQPWVVETGGTLDDLPSPKRAIGAVLRHDPTDQRLAVASAALPPAGFAQDQSPPADRDAWGERKAEQARGLAQWIAEKQQAALPVIVGIDANAPRTDPPAWDAVEYWWDDEQRLLGPEAPARDAYRVWLATADDDRKRIHELRPDGPLACTHLRGNRTPSRYDHLLATRDVGVDWVTHVVHDAFAAGSDHALVHGGFSLL